MAIDVYLPFEHAVDSCSGRSLSRSEDSVRKQIDAFKVGRSCSLISYFHSNRLLIRQLPAETEIRF